MVDWELYQIWLFASAQQVVQDQADYRQYENQDDPKYLLVRAHRPLDAIDDCDDVKHYDYEPEDAAESEHIHFLLLSNL